MENMPENLWGSDRYEKAEEAVQNIEFAMDGIEEAIGDIVEAME